MSAPTTTRIATPTGLADAPVLPGTLATVGALVGHGLRLQARAIVIWGLALGSLSAMIVAIFPSIADQMETLIATYPPEMLAFFGEAKAAGTIRGFLALEAFSMIFPLALGFFAIIQGARTIAGAEERGTLDLFLGNPLPRWQLVASACVGMVLALLGIGAIVVLCTWVPGLLVDVDLPLGAVVAGTLNLLPLCLFFGGLAILVSAFVHRAALAIAVPGGVLLAMYVMNAVANLATSLEWLRKISVFHYYGSAIEHGIAWGSFLGMLLLGVAFVGLAVPAFAKRDIYT